MANSTPDQNHIPVSDSQAGALGWQPTLGWKQGETKTLRREEVVVGPHSGPLDVRGDGYESALLIDKKFRAFHWSICDGSVGQYLVRLMSRDSAGATDAFRRSVDTPLGENETLASHFSAVLSLLAAGVYVLTLEEIAAQSYVVEQTNVPVDGPDLTGFYPGYGAMIATQPVSQLSATHIEQVCERIRQGARPTVITVSAERAWAEFIIDGHHKLSAYRRAAVPAVRLNVVRRHAERLPLADVLEFIPAIGGYHDNLTQNRDFSDEERQRRQASAAAQTSGP